MPKKPTLAKDIVREATHTDIKCPKCKCLTNREHYVIMELSYEKCKGCGHCWTTTL